MMGWGHLGDGPDRLRSEALALAWGQLPPLFSCWKEKHLRAC